MVLAITAFLQHLGIFPELAVGIARAVVSAATSREALSQEAECWLEGQVGKVLLCWRESERTSGEEKRLGIDLALLLQKNGASAPERFVQTLAEAYGVYHSLSEIMDSYRKMGEAEDRMTL